MTSPLLNRSIVTGTVDTRLSLPTSQTAGFPSAEVSAVQGIEMPVPAG